MTRSAKKGPFVDEKVFLKVMKAKETGDRMPVKTWCRACTIVPEFIGQKFAIHNGKQFIELLVTEDMVGHKLGEFSPTRKFRSHTDKK